MDGHKPASSTKRSGTSNKSLSATAKKQEIAKKPRIYANSENDSDYGDADYSTTDSDMAIPGNSKFNMEQYTKNMKKAKAKEEKQKNKRK